MKKKECINNVAELARTHKNNIAELASSPALFLLMPVYFL